MARQHAGTAVICLRHAVWSRRGGFTAWEIVITVSMPHSQAALNKHLSYKHPHKVKEVVNIRTAGEASKCSAVNAIRIRIRSNSSQNYLYSAK